VRSRKHLLAAGTSRILTQFGNRGEYDISPCLLFWR
jgi:hypothetical protein